MPQTTLCVFKDVITQQKVLKQISKCFVHNMVTDRILESFVGNGIESINDEQNRQVNEGVYLKCCDLMKALHEKKKYIEEVTDMLIDVYIQLEYDEVTFKKLPMTCSAIADREMDKRGDYKMVGNDKHRRTDMKLMIQYLDNTRSEIYEGNNKFSCLVEMKTQS